MRLQASFYSFDGYASSRIATNGISYDGHTENEEEKDQEDNQNPFKKHIETTGAFRVSSGAKRDTVPAT